MVWYLGIKIHLWPPAVTIASTLVLKVVHFLQGLAHVISLHTPYIIVSLYQHLLHPFGSSFGVHQFVSFAIPDCVIHSQVGSPQD